MADQVKVFLSYRRADTQHAAGRAADKLAEIFELFMDLETIPPGVDFTTHVRSAVGACDVLLAFIGEGWATLTDETGRRRLDDPQDWVVDEIAVALGRGIPVIPVLVDQARLPDGASLPPSIAALANRQALPLRHPTFSADLTRLIAGIQHAGAASSGDRFAERWDDVTPVVTTVEVKGTPRRRSKAPLLVGAVLLVLAAVIGAVLVLAQPFGSRHGVDPSVSTSAPQASPAVGSAVPPAQSAEELRMRVPAGFRDTCQQLHPTSPVLARELLVALQCAPSQSGAGGAQPEYSFYLQYASPQAARTAFHDYYGATELPAGDCTTGPGEAPYSRADPGGASPTSEGAPTPRAPSPTPTPTPPVAEGFTGTYRYRAVVTKSTVASIPVGTTYNATWKVASTCTTKGCTAKVTPKEGDKQSLPFKQGAWRVTKTTRPQCVDTRTGAPQGYRVPLRQTRTYKVTERDGDVVGEISGTERDRQMKPCRNQAVALYDVTKRVTITLKGK